MKDYMSHIVTLLIGIITTGGVILGIRSGKKKTSAEAKDKDAEAELKRQQYYERENDRLQKDVEKWRSKAESEEKAKEMLADLLKSHERNCEEKIRVLEKRCNQLEEQVAILIAEKK